MTGRVAIATAHWRRLDRDGPDRCSLSRLDHGRRLIRAAWLPPALDRLAPLDQTYHRLAGDRVLYASLQYQAELHIHETGLVTHYPDLWEGWVDV